MKRKKLRKLLREVLAEGDFSVFDPTAEQLAFGKSFFSTAHPLDPSAPHENKPSEPRGFQELYDLMSRGISDHVMAEGGEGYRPIPQREPTRAMLWMKMYVQMYENGVTAPERILGAMPPLCEETAP